jgi:hypothetical protein
MIRDIRYKVLGIALAMCVASIGGIGFADRDVLEPLVHVNALEVQGECHAIGSSACGGYNRDIQESLTAMHAV